MTRLRPVLALFLLTTAADCRASTDGSVVARVNSDTITADDLRSRLHEYRANSKEDPSPEGRSLRERVLNELIEEKVMLTEAKARNLDVAADDLTRALKEVEKDYPADTFQRVLAEKRMSYSRWRERMRLKILLGKVIEAVTRDVPPPAEGAVAVYYRDHPAEFRRPEQVHLQQVVVKTAEDGKRILDELKKGKPFEELARTYSFTPEAGQGGDLGWVEKGVMPAALEEAYLKLAVGRTSPLIETEYGHHVVRVLERRPERTEELGQVRDQIVRTLTQREREQKFSTWRRDVLSRTKIEKNHALLEQIH